MPSSLKLRDIYNEIKVHQPGAKTVEDLNKLFDSFSAVDFSNEMWQNFKDIIRNKYKYPAEIYGYGIRKSQIKHWITTLSPTVLTKLHNDLLDLIKPLNEIKVNEPGLPSFPIKINSEKEYYRIIKLLDNKGFDWKIAGEYIPLPQYDVPVDSYIFDGYPIYFNKIGEKSIEWWSQNYNL
jgi:hypothetical protein